MSWDTIDEDVPYDGKEASGSFGLWPVGEYPVRVEDFKFVKSSQKGTPGLELDMVATEGELNGRHAWHTFWLTEKTMPNVARDVRLITGERIKRPSDLRKINYIGCNVVIKIKHEEYEGDLKMRVHYFIEASNRPETPVDNDIPF